MIDWQNDDKGFNGQGESGLFRIRLVNNQVWSANYEVQTSGDSGYGISVGEGWHETLMAAKEACEGFEE